MPGGVSYCSVMDWKSGKSYEIALCCRVYGPGGPIREGEDMNTGTNRENDDTRPFAAPCRQLAAGAPLRWMAAGWRDYKASPGVSLGYGVIVFAVSLGVSLLAWKLGSYVLVISMLSGFIFVAPLLATGLYSVSRQIRRGKPVSFVRSLRRMRLALRDALVFALVLLVIFRSEEHTSELQSLRRISYAVFCLKKKKKKEKKREKETNEQKKKKTQKK